MNFPFKTLICTFMNKILVVVHKHVGNFYYDSIYCIVLYRNEIVECRILLAVYEACCIQIIIFFDIVIYDDIVISRNTSVVYDILSLNSVINFNTITLSQPCGLNMCYS